MYYLWKHLFYLQTNETCYQVFFVFFLFYYSPNYLNSKYITQISNTGCNVIFEISFKEKSYWLANTIIQLNGTTHLMFCKFKIGFEELFGKFKWWPVWLEHTLLLFDWFFFIIWLFNKFKDMRIKCFKAYVCLKKKKEMVQVPLINYQVFFSLYFWIW